jgi:hypothetical protein
VSHVYKVPVSLKSASFSPDAYARVAVASRKWKKRMLFAQEQKEPFEVDSRQTPTLLVSFFGLILQFEPSKSTAVRLRIQFIYRGTVLTQPRPSSRQQSSTSVVAAHLQTNNLFSSSLPIPPDLERTRLPAFPCLPPTRRFLKNSAVLNQSRNHRLPTI